MRAINSCSGWSVECPLLPVGELERAVGRAKFQQLAVHFLARLHVADRLLLRHFVERGLGDVDAALLDQLAHVAEDERQQQRADVAAVDVGIGHQDELAVAAFGDVFELGTGRDADRLEDVDDFFVVEHFDELRLFDVEDLAPQRQDRLGVRVAARVGRAAGRITFDQVQLGQGQIAAAAVAEFFGQAAGRELALAADHLAGFLGRFAGLGGAQTLCGDQLGDRGIFLEELVQAVVDDRGDDPLDLAVAQLGFGLSLELRIGQSDGNDRGQPFAEVVPLRDVSP